MSEKRFKGIKCLGKEPNEIFIKDKEKDYYIRTEDEVVDCLNEQQSDLNYLARFIGEFKVDEFKEKLRTLRTLEDKFDEQQATIQSLKERLYDFEKQKIIEESEIDENVIPKVKLLRAELFGEKYE